MKNNENKTNKRVAALNYFTSLCFYIVAIINFIKGEIKEYTCFVPIEPAFKVRFYPKGDEYGMYYEDSEAKKLIENKNVEIIIHPNDKNGAPDEMVGASYILDMEDTEKLYNYLVDITK